MSRTCLTALAAVMASAVLVWPAVSPADHTRTQASVSASVVERRSEDSWLVEIRWAATCQGSQGEVWFSGDLFMVDVDTGERHYVGGVVSTSGARSVSGRREWVVASQRRSQHLRPELTIYCYEIDPNDGGPNTTVNGNVVIIPGRFGGGSGGGGGGGAGGGGGGSGDPGEPVGSRGCEAALLGTNGADTLRGGDDHEIIVGFAAGDRIFARNGHDCLIGGTGGDRLVGGDGSDRLTGGAGRDLLFDTRGFNAFDAGSGNDYVNARNGQRELVRCGSGRDRARVDRRDRVRSCELLSGGR